MTESSEYLAMQLGQLLSPIFFGRRTTVSMTEAHLTGSEHANRSNEVLELIQSSPRAGACHLQGVLSRYKLRYCGYPLPRGT